jgi:hypothetical protein
MRGKKIGRPGPPRAILAAALIMSEDHRHVERTHWPWLLRTEAERHGLLGLIPEKLHYTTIYRWSQKAKTMGISRSEAGPLFTSRREP